MCQIFKHDGPTITFALSNISLAIQTIPDSRYTNFDSEWSAVEKGKLIKILLEAKDVNGNDREYDYLMGYFRTKFLGSKLTEKELSTHPNRHAFCHGEQYEYGTKEHALKSVLCIDTLEYVASVVSPKK